MRGDLDGGDDDCLGVLAVTGGGDGKLTVEGRSSGWGHCLLRGWFGRVVVDSEV